MASSKDFFAQYKGVARIIGRYWSAYGGWWGLLTSPYFHFSILVTLVLHDSWLNSSWYSIPISVLPNLIGFSLGGLAIWLAFGDDRFRNLLLDKEESEKHSAYVVTSSSFVHFVFIQFSALLFAICAQALNYSVNDGSFVAHFLNKLSLPINYFSSWRPYASGIGFLLFVYALLSGIAATFQVFRMITLFEKINNHVFFKSQDHKNDNSENDSTD
ncbi:MAG: hypothetical protein ACXV8Q_00670 [Methylobacter sp.]